MSDDYIPGDYYIRCDFSGFKIRRSEARMTWDGFLVHHRFWEPRHPLDIVRTKRDRQSVRNARPEGEDRFLAVNEVQASDL